MLVKLVQAIVVWIVVAFACFVLGVFLGAMHTDVTTIVGSLLQQFDVLIGFLAALWFFFR